MRARLRPFILGSAIVVTLTLAQMQQEVQKLEEHVHTTTVQCQAGQRQACEQGSQRLERLARMQQLIEECQQDDRESCTQLRSLRRR